jgi:hypothetical protein|nr:MAG TPA: hypothetical protein [Bacteriophage sp.]
MKKETFDAKTPSGIAVKIEIEMDCNGWKATHLDVNSTGRYPVLSLNMYSGKTLSKAGFPLPASEELYCVYRIDKNGSTCDVVIAPESAHKMGDEIHALRAARKEQWKNEWQAEKAAEQAALEAKIPGITALQEAYEAEAAYRAAFGRAMEDEGRDGVAMPKRPKANIAELEKAHPRAALYIKADDYSDAMNDKKAAAGEKAKKMLEEGASLEAVEEVLKNWMPESAMWD